MALTKQVIPRNKHMATMKRNNSEITDVVDSVKRTKNNKAKLKNDLNNTPVLFILSDSHEKKVAVPDIDPLPWKDNLIKNHDIFALNNVHKATTVDMHMMSVNSYSSQQSIQTIINNNEKSDDMTFNPYDPISAMNANGSNYEMPDANQAVAFSIQGGCASEDSTDEEEEPFYPIVYFVKRQTLMYCIDHPTDPLKKEIAFQFIRNNFDHVYLCNGDDLPDQSLATYNIKTSQWHALLNFAGKLRVAGPTSIYPPLSMVHFLDDKYEQKRMLGSATLPYFEVQLPFQKSLSVNEKKEETYVSTTALNVIETEETAAAVATTITMSTAYANESMATARSAIQKAPIPADKINDEWYTLKDEWHTLTWGKLYYNLLCAQNFPTIPNNVLKGIVIKPRFGSGGNGIVILRKVLVVNETIDEPPNSELAVASEIVIVPQTIIEATMYGRECPASPSEWLTWDDYDEVPADLGDYFVEPYCPSLAKTEHRVFLSTTPLSSTWLYMCTKEMDLSGNIKVGPLISMHGTIQKKLCDMPMILKEKLNSKLVPGMIFRVDCCFAGVDYPNMLALDWMINEMQLVPVAQSFISDYPNDRPYANQLADGLREYVTKCKHPYYPA
jgi:hypothetical protein